MKYISFQIINALEKELIKINQKINEKEYEDKKEVMHQMMTRRYIKKEKKKTEHYMRIHIYINHDYS